MSYKVVVKKKAAKELAALPQRDHRQIVDAIDALIENPRPHGAKKLATAKDRWRLRVGVYRILYHIDDNAKMITIYRIGHRKDIYRFWD